MSTQKLINIFVVDDNEIFMLALKTDIETVFENTLLKVHLFETGEKCMEQFRQILPDLVILDFHLNTKYPKAANGLEVLKWIKNDNPETSVIMLTTEDNIDVAVKLLENGASDYIVKTETQFKKINYSLVNMLKIIETKEYEKKYMQSLTGFIICLTLLVTITIAVLIKSNQI